MVLRFRQIGRLDPEGCPGFYHQRDRRNLTEAELWKCIQWMDRRKERGGDHKRDEFKSKAPDGAIEKSVQQTAQTLGISARKVERARTIMDHGDQETMDLEPYYTIFEICKIFDISKATVYKWLHGNEVQRPVIPRDGWIRLPGSGQIRIKGEIIKKLMSGDCSPKE